MSVAEIDYIVVVRNTASGEGTQGYVQWRFAPCLFKGRQIYADKIAMLLGGIAAEKIVLGEQFDGSGGSAGSDLQLATDIATLMIVSFGMEDTISYVHATTPEDLQRLDHVGTGRGIKVVDIKRRYCSEYFWFRMTRPG